LDKIISEDEYKRLNNKFQGDLTDIKFRLNQLKQEKEENTDNAVSLLELAQKASSLYLEQVQGKKRDLLNSVYSNLTFGDGELKAKFRKHSDLIAKSNRENQRKKVTSPEESDLF